MDERPTGQQSRRPFAVAKTVVRWARPFNGAYNGQLEQTVQRCLELGSRFVGPREVPALDKP
ncbi:hypothetical protein ABH924_002278 [Arthrobacter sp. GAS37]